MGIPIDKVRLQHFIYYLLVLMLVGLFTSRILLSAGMILFILLTCVHKNLKQQIQNFFRHPILFCITFLFIVPFLSGFWSEDKRQWVEIIRIKLPFLLLPFAFAGEWQLSEKQWRNLALIFLLLVFGGCCWSLLHYVQERESIEKGYLQAKVIATPLENDHVRFSFLVAVAIICSFLMIRPEVRKTSKVLLSLLAAFFAVYLHILSARTGLLSFYLFLVLLAGRLCFTLKKLQWITLLAAVLLAMPLLAWRLLPTFRNRIHYFVYDYSFINSGSYLPGGNDGNRVISYRAGWDILKDHPLGTGAGDLMHAADIWYKTHIPGMLDSDKLLPSSEWLVYGGAAGWPGVLFLTIVMFVPFFIQPIHHRFFWLCLNIISAFSLLFDIGLEVQFGVFIYTFLVLWWWKWMGNAKCKM